MRSDDPSTTAPRSLPPPGCLVALGRRQPRGTGRGTPRILPPVAIADFAKYPDARIEYRVRPEGSSGHGGFGLLIRPRVDRSDEKGLVAPDG